ncbi:MAG: MotA/TolQ/ExbB proton channel family protein [bacterium]
MMRRLAAIFALSTMLILSGWATAQQKNTAMQSTPVQQDSLASASFVKNPNMTELRDFDSIWQLTELGGGIRWGIFFVFALALSFILKKLIVLGLDYWHARKLERLESQTVTVEQVQQSVLQAKSSLLSVLLAKQIDLFENTKKVEVLHEELNSFVALQREHFTRFSNRMSFLSDTAGALGLLGTVWGMFLTFFGGTLDSQRILHGMGIALITTLLGLVVSIVINFASTEVSNFFNRRLERVFEVADNLRTRLFMKTITAYSQVALPENANGAEVSSATFPGEFRLRSLSELKQLSTVGRHLQKPLTVETVNSQGLPVTGVEVVFEVIGEGGYLVDKQTRYSVTSNKRGHAEASFLLTGEIGKRNVIAFINDNENSQLEFQITGIPGPPAKLVSVSGNHQSVSTGQLLSKPFVVALSDAFGNPVKDSTVLFTITKGSGRFAHYNPDNDIDASGLTGMFKKKFLTQKVTFETATDSRGIAEAHLVLGPLPGVNEVTAVARGLSKSPVVFEAMAQANRNWRYE